MLQFSVVVCPFMPQERIKIGNRNEETDYVTDSFADTLQLQAQSASGCTFFQRMFQLKSWVPQVSTLRPGNTDN
jgi:hypothetical protein